MYSNKKRKTNLSLLIYNKKKKDYSLNAQFDERKWVKVKALMKDVMFDFIELSPAFLLTMVTPALLLFWSIQTIRLTHTDG